MFTRKYPLHPCTYLCDKTFRVRTLGVKTFKVASMKPNFPSSKVRPVARGVRGLTCFVRASAVVGSANQEQAERKWRLRHQTTW